MATIPRNIFQTPIHKENKVGESKLLFTDSKVVKSTVKSTRKPLGTLTNQINSASKFPNKRIGLAEHVVKKIDFKMQEVSKNEKPTTYESPLTEDFILEKEEEEYPEIENMPHNPPFADKFEDAWPLKEQTMSNVNLFLGWFPFDKKCTPSSTNDSDFLVHEDHFLADDVPFERCYFKCRPEPNVARPTEFEIDFVN